ncbi:MAG: tyrosine-type recombinase/integrase [Candidatus Competibacteraceae bacterium]|nr:MAG: tyrosine-type recombinase/integrase [Candidatus Competibacteraceae bacterium]
MCSPEYRGKAGIDKKISPNKLRHTYATHLLNADAKLLDIQTLPGYSTINTIPIDTHVGQERMEQVVARLRGSSECMAKGASPQ